MNKALESVEGTLKKNAEATVDFIEKINEEPSDGNGSNNELKAPQMDNLHACLDELHR